MHLYEHNEHARAPRLVLNPPTHQIRVFRNRLTAQRPLELRAPLCIVPCPFNQKHLPDRDLHFSIPHALEKHRSMTAQASDAL